MAYSLINEATGKKLEMPRTGLWYSVSLEEAQEMRKAARDYLRSIGLKSQTQYIRIIDAITGEIVIP